MAGPNEAFRKAIDILAKSDESLKGRLVGACVEIFVMQTGPKRLPSDLQERVDKLLKDVSQNESVGCEGRMVATIEKMRLGEAQDCVEIILNTYEEIIQRGIKDYPV
ncbi:MAG: hypothetical protein A2Y07_01340 [Planctomycetes bacterium GWF2_50_10]|nr:MAG: hypothetical protein A2Y07_01340 [Planctomycetes bacterium GWF2_50_10]HAL44847.1 hypothetical protein [Phycisphaerales bacterium]